MLRRPRDGDVSIPAGRVRREEALVLADRAAAAGSLRRLAKVAALEAETFGESRARSVKQ
ncbi:MAG TPA: hypothetical protein VMI06_18135 [Terriglobia bacterium]|nr:hypothetical protein [Terriglobia bacterium]